MNIKFSVKTIVSMAALFASTASIADPVVYDSAASFAAVTISAGVDSYDDLQNADLGSNALSRTAGAYTYQAATSPSTFYGAGSAGGWLSTDNALATVTFSNFTAGVNAVGGYFFGSSFFGLYQLGSINVTATDGNGTTRYTIANATTSSFLGFASTGGDLLSLTISAVQPNQGVLWSTINDLTLAQLGTPPVTAVPEPESYALMMMGLGSLLLASRRKRRND